MEILLVTSGWPARDQGEFLEDEIESLAQVFEKVTIAPMRPAGPVKVDLPRRVSVDLSLSQHLASLRHAPTRYARKLTAARRVALPNRSGFGFTRSELIQDGKDLRWLRQSLLGRADSASVAGWARRRGAPALAYTFWLGPATAGLRTAWPRTPLVSRVHGGDLYPSAHGWESIPFQRAAVQAVDYLATVSAHGRESLIERYPSAIDKTKVHRLGIMDIGPMFGQPDRAALRILSASSVDDNKRVELIAQVALHLAHTRGPVEWTHLGAGPGWDHLQRLSRLGNPRLVTNFPGQVALERVHQELKSGKHNVFINLSMSEGAPVSLMEAQSVGLPVVATAVGGTPEVVPHDLNELIAPAATVSDIAQAVERAATRPDQEREERRRIWSQNYDADINYPFWSGELCRLATERRNST